MDGRQRGEFRSRYPPGAWWQILAELAYLLLILACTTGGLLAIGAAVVKARTAGSAEALWFFELPRDRPILIWLSISLSGTSGGVAFTLKWLYHTVAKHIWNRDRWIWRVVVPILSGVVAVFLGFMVVSEIVPFFNRNSFENFYVALGFGFFIGYFSDNALAALQRFANKTFGTVSKSSEDKT